MVKLTHGKNASCLPMGYSMRGEDILAVFGIYIDESGDRQKFLVVTACLSTAARWDAFNITWQRLLADYEIDCFHTKEYVSGSSKYTHINGAKAAQFNSDVVGLFDKVGIRVYSVGIDLVEFGKLTDSKWRSRHGTAYTIATTKVVLWAMEDLLEHANEKDDYHAIDIILEDGHPNKSQSLKFLSQIKHRLTEIDPSIVNEVYPGAIIDGDPVRNLPLRIGMIGVGSKIGDARHFPLQVADYSAYRAWKNIQGNTLDGISGFLEVYDKEAIMRVIEMAKDIDTKKLAEKNKLYKTGKILGELGHKIHAAHGLIIMGDSIEKNKALAKKLFPDDD